MYLSCWEPYAWLPGTFSWGLAWERLFNADLNWTMGLACRERDLELNRQACDDTWQNWVFATIFIFPCAIYWHRRGASGILVSPSKQQYHHHARQKLRLHPETALTFYKHVTYSQNRVFHMNMCTCLLKHAAQAWQEYLYQIGDACESITGEHYLP